MEKNLLVWNAKVPEADNLRVLMDLSTILAPRGSNAAIRLWHEALSGNWDGVVGMEFPSYSNYDGSISQLIADRQIFALFQKNASIPTSIDREKVAWEEFQRTELKCQQTNDFFRALQRHPSYSPQSCGGRTFDPVPSLAVALNKAKATIRRVIGERPPSIGELKLRFGPGATTGIKRIDASWQQKLAQTPSCSDELYRSPFFDTLLRELPHWLECHGERVEWLEGDSRCYGYDLDCNVTESILQFRPKNAKTHRAIVIQPTLNSMLQAAFGDWMTGALRDVGVDITDQTKNQRAARVGSLTGGRATIDLKSASDLKARELVKFLFPEAWYELLRDASCRAVSYNGKTFTLEKMSTMGNGFTFPLETLIFWSLARAVSQHPNDLLTYGDDIVCNTDDVEAIIRVLTQCGFEVNLSKSFWDGPFRESCGADYYKGIDIRPVYVKEHLTYADLFVLHNSFYRQHDFELADYIVDQIPEPIRLFGPDGYGDGHLLTEDPPYRRNRKMRRSGWEGKLFDTYREVGCSHPNLYPGDWVSPLYSIYRVGDQPDEDEQFFTLELELTRLKMWRTHGYAPPSRCAPMSRMLFAQDGRALWATPGTTGIFEKVSIYTLGRG